MFYTRMSETLLRRLEGDIALDYLDLNSAHAQNEPGDHIPAAIRKNPKASTIFTDALSAWRKSAARTTGAVRGTTVYRALGARSTAGRGRLGLGLPAEPG